MVRLSPARQVKLALHGPWPLQVSLSVVSGPICWCWLLLASPAQYLAQPILARACSVTAVCASGPRASLGFA